MPIVSFGSFNFAQSHIIPQEIDDSSFRESATASVELPGMIGVFDPYGDEQPPEGEGRVIVKVVLVSQTLTGMTAYWDALMRIRQGGLQKLTMRTESGSERWCNAKCVSIRAPRAEQGVSALHLPVTLTFYVPYPRWLTNGTESAAIWNEATWDVSQWEDIGTAIANTSHDFALTNNGSEYAYPRVVVTCEAGQTVSAIRVQRLVEGDAVDDISHTIAIPAISIYEINCRTQSVLLNGIDAYDDSFTYITADWLRLPSGSNTVRVTITGTASVNIFYYEEYT
jgi:hypothetical protein